MALSAVHTIHNWPLPVHDWLTQQHVAFLRDHDDPLLRAFMDKLAGTFRDAGHVVAPEPDQTTRVIITAAKFGRPLNWRSARMFTARREFNLPETPTVFTAVHVTPAELDAVLGHFERILPTDPPDPADYDFPGLSPQAYKTLFEQGNRGGPLMALARLLQSQLKCIRILLVVGDDQPEYAYIFDLVGAYPRITAEDPTHFYGDIMRRLVTALSTREITNHQVEGPPLPLQTWRSLSTPQAMRHAAIELGKRRFFTEMVRIANLVHVPSISISISSQYSEGCYATWDPQISALIATVTGSARPVEKDAITEDDLALITGVRTDGCGAIVRHVEGKQNDPPSSESVEMMEMDRRLPLIRLGEEWRVSSPVPVVRSKLHGHRGVGGYDANQVEYVPLDAPYYHYPVSCATEAQARGIVDAFARSQALQDPEDPRMAVFTVLPGHGLVVVEKWVPGKQPFQHLYELMDQGALQVENRIPQGPFDYRAIEPGREFASLVL